MTDNVNITEGAGTKVATREVQYSGETAHLQTINLALVSGNDDVKSAKDISPDNPVPVEAYGELVEAIEALRFAVSSLTRSIGMALPNTQGFPIMEVRQGTAGNLQMTAALAAAQTLATLSTLVNQSQIGGFAANDQIPALMHLQADNLRRNITVT